MRSARRLLVLVLLPTLVAACGHSRPPADERLAVPLVPTELPSGYVLSRVDERPTGTGGRWVDATFLPAGSAPTEVRRSVSLHQVLDVEADGAFLPEDGRRMQVRGRPAACGEDGILRWNETRTARISIGGAGLGCAELLTVAESLTEVDAQTWNRFARGARDAEEARTATDFARRSCGAVLGTAYVPDDETREHDRARQRQETADAEHAADLDGRWRALADAQGVLLQVNEGEPVPDDRREAAARALVSACEELRR